MIERLIPPLPLQAEPATAELTQQVVDQARDTASTGFLEISLWAGAIIVVAFVALRIAWRVIRGDTRGQEFSPMGLKGLVERGVIDEEEFERIRSSMAERIRAQLDDEARLKEEAKLGADPIAQIARQAKLEREAERTAKSPESEQEKKPGVESPPPPPPPPPPPRP